MKRLALAAFLFLALLIVGCSGDGQTADDVVPKSTLTPVPPTSSSHSVAMPTETPVVSTDPKTTITPVATLPPTTMHMATPTPSPVPTPMPTVIPAATPTPAALKQHLEMVNRLLERTLAQGCTSSLDRSKMGSNADGSA